MLLSGFNHVAVMTKDTDSLHAFYREVFDAAIFHDFREGDLRLSLVNVGPTAQLNIFELAGNAEADRQSPVFGRGRIDHLGLEAASHEAFDEIRSRLISRNATDGFVTDFGIALSLFFTDPDGLEGEVCLHNPNATPADLNPPGTPAAGYTRVS
jgi:catechol 2,3-dioxygenase-like lactoylglutathione lyase family enzyme